MSDFICQVDEQYLSACKNLPEYQDTGYCVLHFPGEGKVADFEKAKQSKLKRKEYDFSGAVFPEGTSDFEWAEFDAYTSFKGATFVGIADFIGAQFSGKRTYFHRARFSGKRADFRVAKFRGLRTFFSEAKFSGEKTDFTGAQFGSELTTFARAEFSGKTYFSRAQFSGRTEFQEATFEGLASFFDCTYERQAHFSSATFETVSFEDVGFEEETYFDRARFKREAYFRSKREAYFRGLETFSRVADFQFARIEKPEVFSFHRARLRPSWFVNVDPRKFDFTEVQWPGRPGGPQVTLADEISSLKERNVQYFYNSYILLSQVCQRLSANAEENREYPLANHFHYWSMDALRKESWDYRRITWKGLVWIRKNWLRVAKRCGPATTLRLVWDHIRQRHRSRPKNFGLIHTLYWASSGYVVRPTRASVVLLGMWLMFAVLYFLLVESSPFWVFSASDMGQGIKYAGQALIYSLSALVRLNPRPQSEHLDWFQTLVTIEGILGPLQIALLALAIRRKVMR